MSPSRNLTSFISLALPLLTCSNSVVAIGREPYDNHELSRRADQKAANSGSSMPGVGQKYDGESNEIASSVQVQSEPAQAG